MDRCIGVHETGSIPACAGEPATPNALRYLS